MTDDRSDDPDDRPRPAALAACRPQPVPEPERPPGQRNGPGANRAAGKTLNQNTDLSTTAKKKDQCRSSDAELPLVDRFGNRHSLAALSNWSETAQRALGLRPVDGGKP